MKTNPVTLILAVVFFFPILKGFLSKFSSPNLKLDIEDINKTISFVFSLFLGIYYSKKIFIEHNAGIYKDIYERIPKNMTKYIENNFFMVYVVLTPLIIFIIYKIIFLILDLLNSITIYPMLDKLEDILRDKGNIFKRIFGALFNIPKSICYILLIAFVLNVFSMFIKNDTLNKYLQSSKIYNNICKQAIIPVTNSKIAKKLPNIINNSFKIVVKEEAGKSSSQKNNFKDKKTIVYYNGVTLEEGIKSNKQINNFARHLAAEDATSKGKAKIIYDWIGTNIDYDHDKAKKVLRDNFQVKSGAIPTFNSKSGICFDYSCLFIAMCRANDIKVRLVTGEGFNGVSWVSHAWNQVYIPEEGRWINVDTTFYKGGNYFDTKRFDIDHRKSQIAGEW
ncbi:transglutaminase-like domain-containing protein [Clostridium botulinum]|uniref:transglutaminase-like domain-containing protein n=1 Tax=Clostridium botulinum TaxID=1491 RepID=UPI000D12AC36|nr:transglutaminase-like domain-containing protein [Clostridium botulinum]AVQ46835.1 transglutaminase [Clostridium botulinum]AVQ50322.1 transglutaminase [Clostridium botulinum]